MKINRIINYHSIIIFHRRRYNYTTPKSFLEQIKLYETLLGKKSKELQMAIERLENGLEKLRSTASQVRESTVSSRYRQLLN